MPSTIQFANAEQLMYFLQLYQQYYAAAQVGSTPVDIAVGLQFTETGGRVIAGEISSSQISGLLGAGTNYPATTAGQAMQQYIAAGGTTSNALAATGTGSAQIVANGAVASTSAGAKVVGLLSMNLPTVAAAIAPIAGVALGVGLYEANPAFWEKISKALLPFCYEDTELMPVAVDENGSTYFPQEAIDSLKTLIEEEGASGGIITETSGQAVNDFKYGPTPFPFTFYLGSSIKSEGYSTGYGNFYREYTFSSLCSIVIAGYKGGGYSEGSAAFSKEPFRIHYRNIRKSDGEVITEGEYGSEDASMYGKPIYYSNFANSQYGFPGFTINVNISARNPGEAGWYSPAGYLILYGSGIEYQEGITQWKGNQYPEDSDSIEIVTGIDGENVTTKTYQPITTPVGDPGVSADPELVPDLTKNPNPDPAIGPWIPPSPNPNLYPDGVQQSNPAPLPDPVPNSDPMLDPNADPSKKPPKDPTTTETTKPPTSSGDSQLPELPLIPVLPSAASGLLHVYNPTQAQIDAFGSWLWTTFSGDLIDTVSKLFNDPMDAVIGLHELYATPAVSGSSTIKAGFLDSNVPSNVVGSRYTTINCGSIVVQEFYQNYLDYSPYTKCFIYLPFVGIVPVLADDIIGNAVNITYHIDSYTGCCIAVVTVAREGYSSAVYQFEGNCAVEIPITSGYQSTLMGALIGVAGTALTGNPHVGLAAASMGRASLGKNDVSHSGSFGSSYGAMGAKIPYIIVKRPTQKSVVNYNQEYGFPAHKRVTIGACSGYLRAREVHVISPTATDEEKARIEELLKEGVFVK